MEQYTRETIVRAIEIINSAKSMLSVTRNDGLDVSFREIFYKLGDKHYGHLTGTPVQKLIRSQIKCWDNEIGWLYNNCPEYAAIKTPWDDDTYVKVQQWRHATLDQVLKNLNVELGL